jgi:Protein of unknown function (DUF805)
MILPGSNPADPAPGHLGPIRHGAPTHPARRNPPTPSREATPRSGTSRRRAAAPASPRGYLQSGGVGFREAVTEAFRNMFSYQGRASRSAWWWFFLFDVLAWIGVWVLFFVFAAVKVPALGILLLAAAMIGLVLAGLPLGVRRLHDQDRSGFWWPSGRCRSSATSAWCFS